MMRRWNLGAVVVLLITVAVVLVACETELVETVERREPFSSQRESEDGIVVQWSGHTAGYEPGEEAEVETTFTNNSDQIWPVRFCLQLLDRRQGELEIIGLEEREFDLDPGVGQSSAVSFGVPPSLEPAAYGLALVVQRPGGPMADVIAIEVGGTDASFAPVTAQENKAALDACLPGAEMGIGIPGPNASVTLPLRILACGEEPGREAGASLTLDSGVEGSRRLDVLEGLDGNGVVIGYVNFMSEGPPPQLEAIRERITQTVLQFDKLGIQKVTIGVAGETESVLQP